MRPVIPILCGCALLALTGLVIGQDQEQGPLAQPGQTVAKPKNSGSDSSGASSTSAPAASELPKVHSEYKKEKDLTNLPTFKADVAVVTLDVAVVDNHGQFIPGIPSGNFRVLEDNVPQKIERVDVGQQAPLTVALLVEFSDKFQSLWSGAWFQTQEMVWTFANSLRPQDYCAVIMYDMHTNILTDFTTDRSKIREALSELTIPAWREANMFDAVTDVADRMSGIEGRKAILLVTSGIDTFSKLTYDQARKKLQEAGVPIYSISLLGLQRELAPSEPIEFLQADNELRTFAKETGGAAYFPKFFMEYPQVFGQIEQALRSQYVITYSPSNKARDGTFRKIKVELVDAQGKPLPVRDQKGKPIKYAVLTKAGYKAPHEVE